MARYYSTIIFNQITRTTHDMHCNKAEQQFNLQLLYTVFFLIRIFFLVTAVCGRPKAEICPLPGRFRVNTLTQGVLRQFTRWPWILYTVGEE